MVNNIENSAVLIERIDETMNRLMKASSAASVCALLDARDRLVAADVDLAIEYDVDLDGMPWAVTAEELSWAGDAAAVHCDGHAIFYVDDWEFVPLDDLWLSHCGVKDIEDMTEKMRAAYDIWMAEVLASQTAFRRSHR